MGVAHVVSLFVGVWATRADYLPRPLEPREMHNLLSPQQQRQSHHDNLSLRTTPSPQPLNLEGSDDKISGGEEADGNERNKMELERGIKEALFRMELSSEKPYKGQPLQGAWATAGQTGALMVTKPGEPRENSTPVKFNVGSPGSRSPSREPSQFTPPRQSKSPNWSTPSPSSGHRRRGNRGRFQHSHSGPERNYEANQRHKTNPRHHNSEQYPVQNDQSNHQNKSHDTSNQSYANNWHLPANRRSHGNSDTRRGRGRGRGGPRREGRGEGGEREHRSQQYRRCQSDVTANTRGGGASDRSKKLFSEPTIREH